jgi:hypothetical protein
MKRCLNCGCVYTVSPVKNDSYCSISCFKFMHNDVLSTDSHLIVAKIIRYNEDDVPELDTMEKVLSYKELQAQYGD